MRHPSAAEEATVQASVNELGIRLHALVRGIRLIKQHRVHERPGIPAGMVGMLLELDKLREGCHARDLTDRTGLDQSTISRAVTWLVAHGLVERRTDPTDRRAAILAVTPAGRAALVETYDWYGEVLGRALADWTPDEVGALAHALDRFTRDIEGTLRHHDDLEAAR
ncbi:MarR family winged helix-turn-helix transcriptional regulator [Micromonospora echinofusca]|uniref:MarR family transcriptional regulator n=1 Tax=Micromonospora echinofusca TaxID=47858 RepID=A0ABS3VL42_MICEH|nr:MarR family transcriptional regulator [Micromonospora echinofusca]MBO4205247.1 MarR family transcriptional regulator [Micromonospora echinofusca]